MVARVVATVLTIAAIAMMAVPARPRPPAPTSMNLVVITLDTTRADRLSVYGYQDIRLPHLERLAREGAVFERAMSVAPLTLPAHTTLFTGLLPPTHRVRDNSDAGLDPSFSTLAERLADRGVWTAAFVGAAVLRADRGLKQGFDVYDDRDVGGDVGRLPQRRADAVVFAAEHWLRGQRAPFFLWTHFYDPHRPYDAPEPFASAYVDPYLSEIAFVDAQIGRLLATLEQRGDLDRTIIVVAGDHGESLGDHGERDHGRTLYDSTMHVPLIVRDPRRTPERIAQVVSLSDVMPTLLRLLNVDPPPMDGVDLFDADRRRAADREAYAESRQTELMTGHVTRALRDRRFKLIDGSRRELYDLDADPFELHDIAAERPSLARGMARRLDQLAPRAVATPRSDARGDRWDDLRRALAALGYVGGSGR